MTPETVGGIIILGLLMYGAWVVMARTIVRLQDVWRKHNGADR